MKSKILYIDKDILVIDKPAGIAVQTKKCGEIDCESEIKNELKTQGMSDVNLSVINRLDQPVSGIVLFALNKKAAAILSEDLKNNNTDKIYKAKIYGHPENKKGVLTDYIYKDGKSNTSYIVNEKDKRFKDAKKAVLEYEEYEDGYLTIKLITGRHHQIRVQTAGMGHPILGDMKYGNAASTEETKRLAIKNICLNAYSLSFNHPSTMERMTFTSKHSDF